MHTFANAGLYLSLFLVSGSCTPALDLVPHPHPLSTIDRIARSSLIVVGVVQSEASAAWVHRKNNGSGMPLELRRVSLRVEGVIKGRYDGSRLQFVYFCATGPWDGPAPNLLAPGERAIFYLLSDGNILRATNDAYSSHTEIVTGKHRIQPAARDQEVREMIVRLLLLPGEDLDTNRYVASLYVEMAQALDLTDKLQVAYIFRTLLNNQSAPIRARACVLLAEPPLNQRDCLQDLVRDSKAPEVDRKRAQHLIGASR